MFSSSGGSGLLSRPENSSVATGECPVKMMTMQPMEQNISCASHDVTGGGGVVGGLGTPVVQLEDVRGNYLMESGHQELQQPPTMQEVLPGGAPMNSPLPPMRF